MSLYSSFPRSQSRNPFQSFTYLLWNFHTKSVRKVSDLRAGKEKQVYLERWKPNHPQSSLLGIPHASPSSAAIVGITPRESLLEWCLACCHCSHNVLSCLKSLSFQWYLELGEQPEVTGRVRSLMNHRSLILKIKLPFLVNHQLINQKR